MTRRAILLFVLICFADSEPDKKWWNSASFYQVSPVSFKDSNNDGYGDIQGLIGNLNYIVDSGFDSLFLSPFYETPFKDYGYDISNYTAIDPKFGNEADVDQLLLEARRHGLKVVVDFVPNHSSNEHEWFINSENGIVGFENFYIWHSGIPTDTSDRPLPPNGWESFYGGSSWQWSEKRQAYYYHAFGVMQPDLNLREPSVLDELQKILLYWLQKGVDGFRIDAVSQLFEDPNLVEDPLIHNNLNETYELVDQWRRLFDNYTITNGGEEKVLVPQVWESQLDALVNYFRNGNGDDLTQLPTNFIIINELHRNSRAADYKRTIDNYLTVLPEGAIANWFLGTHDHSRVASRMGPDRISGLTMLLLTLPGVAFTYSGDELLMLDYRDISWKDTTDMWACNSNPIDYKMLSRDPNRTPFQWNGSINGGFNSGTPTWIPSHPNYVENNLELQRNSPMSHYKYYKRLLQLRKHSAFVEGDFSSKILSENVFAYSRSIDNATFLILINVGNRSEIIDTEVLNALNAGVKHDLKMVLVSPSSAFSEGDVAASDNVPMEPFDALIAEIRMTNS
ncbi:maltase 1-like [Bradysia coprophila]|uniref:maltase 1-like n=1 Tax=Bradysia coprophila TaxID=38358 RepID=UPI00187DD8CA|nr:maltase 1-like [Bradysia coprophila]